MNMFMFTIIMFNMFNDFEDNNNNLIMIMNTPATGDGVYFANYHETQDPVKIFEEPEKYLLLTTGWGCGCCGGRRGSAA